MFVALYPSCAPSHATPPGFGKEHLGRVHPSTHMSPLRGSPVCPCPAVSTGQAGPSLPGFHCQFRQIMAWCMFGNSFLMSIPHKIEIDSISSERYLSARENEINQVRRFFGAAYQTT